MSDNVAQFLKLLTEIEAAGTGYDQGQRTSFFDKVTKQIIRGKETDCSALTLFAYWLAGFPVNVSGTVYTGNAKELLVNAGFEAIDVRRWSAQEIRKILKPGDSVVGPGHIVAVGFDGRILSAEKDERGKASGGQAGDQTGVEVLWRPELYSRANGWSWVLRPPADAPATSVITTPGFTHRVRWANKLNVREKPTTSSLGRVLGSVSGGTNGTRGTQLNDPGVLVRNSDGTTAWWRKFKFESGLTGWVNVNYLQPLS